MSQQELARKAFVFLATILVIGIIAVLVVERNASVPERIFGDTCAECSPHLR